MDGNSLFFVAPVCSMNKLEGETICISYERWFSSLMFCMRSINITKFEQLMNLGLRNPNSIFNLVEQASNNHINRITSCLFVPPKNSDWNNRLISLCWQDWHPNKREEVSEFLSGLFARYFILLHLQLYAGTSFWSFTIFS